MVLYRSYKMFNLIDEIDYRYFEDIHEVSAAYPSSSSPESSTSDYSGDFHRTWEEDDFLKSVKYDQIELEQNPELFTFVSPVHCSPIPSPPISLSPDLPAEDCFTDVSSSVPWHSILSNVNPITEVDQRFVDYFSNDGPNPTYFEDTVDSVVNNKLTSIVKIEPSIDSVQTVFNKPSHLDFDHCYSKVEKEEKKINFWDVSPYSPESSETSSEEVDVVTVTEESSPIVPKVVRPKKTPRKRGRKCANKKTSQPAPVPISAKSLKAAIKNNRITTVQKTQKRKNKNNLLDICFSSSNSEHSSQCNSDVEDAGKRANHNSSERKRREILKNNLQNLRISVPSTKDNPKAAKVAILNGAANYVTELRHTEQELMKKKRQEEQKRRQKEAELKALLSQLKRQYC